MCLTFIRSRFGTAEHFNQLYIICCPSWYATRMFVFDAKLIFGTSNFVVFYVSINHVIFFLQGLHAIFTGEDDTWDASWLKIPSFGFSATLHFQGTGIRLRRGYAPSQSPKPTHVYFLCFMVGRCYIMQRYGWLGFLHFPYFFLQKETAIRLRCKPFFMLLTISFSNANTIVFLNLYCRWRLQWTLKLWKTY